MRLLCGIGLVLCALAPAGANADGNGIIYYTPIATIGDDEVAGKGDGFGGRVRLGSGALVMNLEYSTVEFDFFDEGIDQLRGGLGVAAGDLAEFDVEYVKLDFGGGDTADGFGAHVQLGRPSAQRGGGFLKVGYLKLDEDGEELSGLEYSVGAMFPMGQVLGLVEFRSSRLEFADAGFETYLEDLHVGISVPF